MKLLGSKQINLKLENLRTTGWVNLQIDELEEVVDDLDCGFWR